MLLSFVLALNSGALSKFFHIIKVSFKALSSKAKFCREAQIVCASVLILKLLKKFPEKLNR